jgi:hypothetical protein
MTAQQLIKKKKVIKKVNKIHSLITAFNEPKMPLSEYDSKKALNRKQEWGR